ncbi:MAG: hypothetical protein ABF260_07705 [Flavobacteriaceae bacterium]
MKVDNKIFEVLKSSKNDFKPWNGINAKKWGDYFSKIQLNKKLDKKLTRNELLDTFYKKELTDEELGIAILSWGGMNREHGKSLFQNKEWLQLIKDLRNNQIKTREEAYNLFAVLRQNKKLKGMGPAYFTKLICFVNPGLKGYIMDQWTSKSINILYDKKIIHLTKSGHVSDKNTGLIYEEFCAKIEELANRLSIDPMTLEENLFSSGGINKGNWRKFIVDNWGEKSKKNKKIKLIKFIDMEVIKFEDAVNNIKDSQIVIPTLGGRSKIKVEVDNNLILITNSKNNQLGIDKAHWDKIMDRLLELPQEERGMTSRYGVGKHSYSWKDCPNQVFSIYVPAIIKYLCN